MGRDDAKDSSPAQAIETCDRISESFANMLGHIRAALVRAEPQAPGGVCVDHETGGEKIPPLSRASNNVLLGPLDRGGFYPECLGD